MASIKADKPVGTQPGGQAKKEPAKAPPPPLATSQPPPLASSQPPKKVEQKPLEHKKKAPGTTTGSKPAPPKKK